MNKKTYLTAIAHILGWLLYFSFPFIMEVGSLPVPPPPPDKSSIIHTKDSLIGSENIILLGDNSRLLNKEVLKPNKYQLRKITTITNSLLLICFYLNLIFFNLDVNSYKSVIKYVATQILILLSFRTINTFLIKIIVDVHPFIPFGFILLNFFAITTVALCYNLIRDSLKKERLAKEKQNAALLSELLFLRWQMSPHFLFNVLNNMVSLARSKSDRLENMIIDLSNLMRYMLYETDDEKVTIEKELTYIESYIELQKQRFGSEINIELNVPTTTDSEMEIEPMLLIPFIENAFKHGTVNIEHPNIDITIKCEQNILQMVVINDYKPDISLTKDPTKGIGLSNVKRRLELLYTNKYSLAVKREENVYSVTLEIRLS